MLKKKKFCYNYDQQTRLSIVSHLYNKASTNKIILIKRNQPCCRNLFNKYKYIQENMVDCKIFYVTITYLEINYLKYVPVFQNNSMIIKLK